MFNRGHLLFIIISLGIIIFSLLKSKPESSLKNSPLLPIATVKSIPTNTPIYDNVFDEVNPVSGFEFNAAYNDLGPKMLSLGVIDLNKFIGVYERSGQSLTDEEKKILTEGSTEKIKIARGNSHFLLNFFWAVGLANKSKILTEGEIVKYGGTSSLGNFASTGGWSLGAGNAMQYYSKGSLVTLSAVQEDRVSRVASNIFRPCCNNSTAFPDCNHGMALLGILEVMAAGGATEDEMYKAAKYVNAFWFPGNYYDLAVYFKNKENKSFAEIDPKLVLSKSYSSASGYQTVKKWLSESGIIKEAPKQGSGCGV